MKIRSIWAMVIFLPLLLVSIGGIAYAHIDGYDGYISGSTSCNSESDPVQFVFYEEATNANLLNHFQDHLPWNFSGGGPFGMNFGIHDTECPPQSYDKASAAFFSLERSHFRFRYVENDYLWGDWGLAAAHRDHTCPLHKGQDFDAERDNSVDEFDDGGHDTVLVWYGFTDERDTCDGEESPDGYWAIIEVVAH